MRKVVLVGPVPAPIGGVSTYIYRLCTSDDGKLISHVVDAYRSNNKRELPSGIRHVVHNRGKFSVIWLFFNLLKFRNQIIHFNFSTVRSLWLLLFLPKFNNRWILMLHNGELGVRGFFQKRVVEKVIDKMDSVFCISEKQMEFYSSITQSENKYRMVTSYIQLGLNKIPDNDFYQRWKCWSSLFGVRFVLSGYPTKIYRHIETLEYFVKSTKVCISVFLYGADSDGLLEDILAYDRVHNIRIFWCTSENTYLEVLRNSDVYLRPNSVDSMGISVHDALSFGKVVIASNACKRPDGVFVFSGYAQYIDLLDQAVLGNLDSPKRSCPDSFCRTMSIYRKLQ